MARVALALLPRPDLWAIACRQVFRLAAPGWWRRAPFLPLPDPGYLQFRLETMYGGDTPVDPAPADIVTYLEWCKVFPTVS